MKTRRWIVIDLLVGLATLANGALVYTEEWNASDSGWQAKDVYMALTYADSFGNPAGSLKGTFAEQPISMPEVDAFRATSSASGGAFTGDYVQDLGGAFWGWRFSFYAADYMPSELQLRFSDGTNVFFYNALPQLGSVGTWYSISVAATSSVGWFGGSGAAWSNALRNVAFVEVQVLRSATGQQESYYLDNFENVTIPIPEPATFGLVLIALGTVRYWRRSRRLSRAACA